MARKSNYLLLNEYKSENRMDEYYAIVSHYIQLQDLSAKEGYKKLLSDSGVDITKLPSQKDFNKINNVPYPSKSSKFTFIDLFVGIGGFRMALQNNGGACVFSSEWDESAKETYFENYGEVPFGDITKIDPKSIPDFDVLAGGFPCQPFSSIGKREGFKHKTQGTLFFYIAEIIKEKKPKAFILENVTGLLTHDEGRTYETIMDVLQNELEYKVFPKVLNSADFGVPQERKRLYFVGFRKDIDSSNASVLSNRENFEKWVTGDRVKVGVQYSDFEKIVNFFNLNKEEIKEIEATADKDIIGNLESSGMPKTDVIVYVYFKDPNKDIKHFTISCKKTNEKAVSVHQYNADAFADALNPNDSNLRILLNAFQKYGNLRDFGEDNKALLTESLKPYMKKLVRWVLGGFCGKNRTDVQLANYILISDDKDIFIHTIDEYTEELLKPENIVHFGTPFGWTYASGRKGKDIQLKCKIIK